MSVDCGLPDFSGTNGIINKINNKDYRNIINPKYFEEEPNKFWYIYGDRYNQYKKAFPHKGYHILNEICCNTKKGSYYLYTSNVDNMWQKTGFTEDKLYELHGNIFHL